MQKIINDTSEGQNETTRVTRLVDYHNTLSYQLSRVIFARILSNC